MLDQDRKYSDALALVCAAAEASCEHPEQAPVGREPFCGKCLSCRAGGTLVRLVQLASEHRKRGT